MKENQWSIEDSMHLYQVKRWSDNYFTINQQGELCASINKDGHNHLISISDIIQEMKKENIAYPCVIRFHDILRSQVNKLNETFRNTINKAGFKGAYKGVFPIKVNQLKEVIEEVVDAGDEYSYGLEAGSKTELITVLAYNKNPEALTVLNGYKDEEYFELACLGQQIGRNIIIVIEKFSEIFTYIKVCNKLDVYPNLGIRAKLSTKGSGMWADSTGDHAKFGLSLPEILEFIKLLKSKSLIDKLQLFHFHTGSQIPDIRTIKEGITEGARIYTELKRIGAPIQFFDVGGGVGLNYDGSRSNCSSSTNYNLEDYIADVVYILRDICDQTETIHPNIVTETGRATCAYHSCVITNVFGNVELTNKQKINIDLDDSDPLIVKNMKELSRDLDITNYQETYNDAFILKEEAISAFKLGILNVEQRALVESLFSSICGLIINMTENQKYVPNEIKKLKYTMASKYLCNFSVFQSAPDSWAIGQILPVMPIRKLNQMPNNESTLADITCDSDGKINKFLSPDGQKLTVPLHDINHDEDYPIGLFLTGAYQDIMGDMHNLFGRLNEVHVFADKEDPQGFYIEEVIQGQSASDVLSIMQYSPDEMCKIIKREIDNKIKQGKIKPRVGVKLTDFYESSIKGYTYLEGF